MLDLIRVTCVPIKVTPAVTTKALDQFTMYLPDGRQLGTRMTRQPRYDGARELLKLGYPPDVLMTTRHAGKAYDSWKPAPIGELAQWTMTERDKGGLSKGPYQPFDEVARDRAA